MGKEGGKERVKDKKHDKKGEPKRWQKECGGQGDDKERSEETEEKNKKTD